MSDIRILDAATAKAEHGRLAEILSDCVERGASVSFMSPFSVADAHAWWSGIIDKVAAGDVVLFGAYDDGTLIGTVQLGLDVPPNQPHRADVRKLLVHSSGRRKGAASALMTSLQDHARDRGLTLLVLDTVTGSPAETLYASLGWTKSGIIPNYALFPDGRSCDTTVFWKALG